MTRCLSSLLLVLALATTLGARPILDSRPSGFDFGLCPKGSTLVQQFVLVSAGDEPVELTDIKTGCNCVAAVTLGSTLPGRLAPGDSLLVRVEWQTRTDSGLTSRTLLVFADNLVEPLRVKVSASVAVSPVNPPVVVGPASLTMPHGKSAGRPVNQVRLVNKTNESLLVRSVGTSVEELEIIVPDSIPAAVTETVSIRPIRGFDEVAYERSFTLEFSPSSGPAYRVTVPVQKGDFSYRPTGTTYK
jgi:hypothetical protein